MAERLCAIRRGSGDLQVVGRAARLLDPRGRAPDFARFVEIHRNPGYDPSELFLDPDIASPKLAIGKRLLLPKMGFRALMDVIPLDATLVGGSHGRATDDTRDGPLIISDRADLLAGKDLAATDVKSILLDAIFA